MLLSFTDNGTGISKTDLPYIFQRFYRGKNPDSSQKISSGLGLSIVKHTVDLHKGKIDVSSNPGDKTVFRISFPKTEL
ncbi:MAG: HAMP domain-containing histidine kinase [Actinobacteria bacterium]|nr:HAMP domain-containing histidine kinase [Actinomycetota bacterium]